jgi:Papain family cysteine protease
MLDNTIRIVFVILVGLTIAIAVAWYVGFLYQEIRGTGQVVIDPVTVIDSEGKGNDELGKAFAQMLQARVQSLVGELRDAQDAFTIDLRARAVAQAPRPAVVGDVRLWTQAVALQTDLLQPVDMKLSVAGVDVGGMLPWLQRRLSSHRTLHFTFYAQPSEAQIFGSLAALGVPDASIRLRMKGQDDKPPPLDVIIDGLAHEIVHRYLARDSSNKLDVLDSAEFTTLSEVLVSVAQANRKSIRGRPAQKDFEILIPTITSLADKVPDWPELGYLAAKIAESGRDSHTALAYYRRVQPNFESSGRSEIVRLIATRIAELTSSSREAVTAAVGQQTFPTAVDYSNEIRSVRDSGPEGSVVGLALATALEFQIARTTNKQQSISARYIYYAARKQQGSDLKSDSGASIKDAITVLSTEGAVAEEVWPYRPGEFAAMPPAAVKDAARFRITGATELTTIDGIKGALNRNGPVVAGISLFEGAMEPNVSQPGLLGLPTKKEQIVGGHAIVIVGYDDEKRRFKFVNSWGRTWGEEGFGYLPYEYFTKYGFEAWTFTLSTTD